MNVKVLGIVSETMVRGNVLQSVETATVNYTEEVLGLGVVFKSTAIKEVVVEAVAKSV